MSNISDPNAGTGRLLDLLESKRSDELFNEKLMGGIFSAYGKDTLDNEDLGYIIYLLSCLVLSTGDEEGLKSAISLAYKNVNTRE